GPRSRPAPGPTGAARRRPDPRGSRRSVRAGVPSAAVTRGSALDAARFVGPDGDLDSVPGAELGHQAGEMGLHGAETDVEFVGDLGVGPAPGHGDQKLFFAAGWRAEGVGHAP